MQDDVYLAVCAIYRNEARYLREWIEFHLLVGVERFYLYDNNSDDEHHAILEPYLAEGTVVLEDWPVSSVQHLAYERCLKKRRNEAHWIAYIDLDEFLFSPTYRPLPEILGEFEGCPGIGVNIATFGTPGDKTEPDELAIKSIVDPQYALHCWGAHSFLYVGWSNEYEGATFEEPVWALVLPVNERRQQIALQTHDRTSELSYSLLRVNHYGARPERGGVLNSEPDETIQLYLPSLREAIRRREGG